ncbi:DUF3099 domain-containing protein [Corynebacterium bovis]|uniref:DUF3099 domain-containing protein n=1 Tax=Corynebacterium bovis TaxID=36808 RepID=UPI00244B2DB2|nr:DUF3099 domain-containing protein [Corynebacterium bovis]MDH2455095.1 DUF3099 domain-containing protein [Corynebacterium bovis]
MSRRHIPGRRGRGTGQVSLITDARRSPLENWHHRRRVYAALQLARLPIFAVAGVVLWLTHNVAATAAIGAVSLPLPWIAVLLANEKGEGGDPRERRVYKPGLARENRARIAAEQLAAVDRVAVEGEGAGEAADEGTGAVDDGVGVRDDVTDGLGDGGGLDDGNAGGDRGGDDGGDGVDTPSPR